ncbi:MAG: hypothetical protein NWQ43_05890 [Dolichospermum sp.]|uniref:hypothetical protein n=1 Tax=Anabaena sp. UHCC 0187 TaxID=2590018 RepID=UPI0015804AF1|nr:hypothetical protein [Anabaena sp. UHCC 0187]MDP5016822.1 hypothetical protein [Dolichospermum sp.]
MTNKKSNQINFKGMIYREVQRTNSNNRKNLHKEDQKRLKDNGYKNVGWDNVIKLYQEIKDFLDKYQLQDLTLEELFLEADHIGNKYLSHQEIQQFNQKLAKEVNEIAEEIDKQFPDTEIEIIDFSRKTKHKYTKNKNNQKLYRTIKF